MLCCCRLEILNFWTRDPVLSLCTGPCRSYSWSCLQLHQTNFFPLDLTKIDYNHLNLCVMANNLIGGNMHLSFHLHFFDSQPGWLCSPCTVSCDHHLAEVLGLRNPGWVALGSLHFCSTAWRFVLGREVLGAGEDFPVFDSMLLVSWVELV